MAIILISVGIFVYSVILLVLGEKTARKEMIAARIHKSSIRIDDEDRSFEDIPFFDRIIKPVIDNIISSIATLVPISEKEKANLSLQLFNSHW